MKLEFWFEFASTYSYPVAMKIENLSAQYNVPVVWKPFLLGPIFKAQGWHDSPFNIYPAKGKYMWRDMERICQEDGLNLVKPSVFPRNGLLASRVACLFCNEKWVKQFVRSVFIANFEKDQEISDKRIIASCLPFPEHEALSMIDQAEQENSKLLLRQNTEDAIKLGLFGAPTFVVGKEIFWGGDRLQTAFEWAKT